MNTLHAKPRLDLNRVYFIDGRCIARASCPNLEKCEFSELVIDCATAVFEESGGGTARAVRSNAITVGLEFSTERSSSKRAS